MDARDRYLTVLCGQEPDKIPVFASDSLRLGPQGGWLRRLVQRGLGISHIIPPYVPNFISPYSIHPFTTDIRCIEERFLEDGLAKIRYTYCTPVGAVTCLTVRNPGLDLDCDIPKEHLVKDRSDWRVMSYIFRKMTEAMRPNYRAIERDQDALGGGGVTIAAVDKTPFQRAWIELATMERVALDFKKQPEELLEYLESQRSFHQRAAEIAAGAPSPQILILDNVTNVISPTHYEEHCLKCYQLYASELAGTGKVLSVHMDGLLRHLRDGIARSPIDVIDSLSVPPVGNVSLTEARLAWPGKIPFVNLAAHLAQASDGELHDGYAQMVQEWGSKAMGIEHVEDLALDRIEPHLAAALDVCGY